MVNYICLNCEATEDILFNLVRNFDRMDDRDPNVPPQLACEACGGEMYPESYKGVHGYEYRIENRLTKKEAAQSTQNRAKGNGCGMEKR
ncbi:hypothetical protein CF651_09510 [Paenibacillus rigui]|uniref:Uncharacterized protein n=1 Tax=Paenibacillus rigui TaxID=554312 RepID=A0A229UTL4_9BACL|nr:hypothetical protein CF651_09510 [Paenibacillus rigui]